MGGLASPSHQLPFETLSILIIQFPSQSTSIPPFPLPLPTVSPNLHSIPNLTSDGTPVSEIQRLRDHWLNTYSWRTHESSLNAELPQFTLPVQVDGFGTLTIHFVHKRSSRENAIPLIFVHGWPGSFLEIRKVLDELTEPSEEGAQAFHVVA